MIYFVSCEYDDSGYLKIEVKQADESIKVFEGSDPLIVWYEYQKYFYTELAGNYYVTNSSSMDHWFFDTEGYHEEYFNPETFEFINWRKLQMWDVGEKYPSCVVKDGMKNFQELKDYVKLKQN